MDKIAEAGEAAMFKEGGASKRIFHEPRLARARRDLRLEALELNGMGGNMTQSRTVDCSGCMARLE